MQFWIMQIYLESKINIEVDNCNFKTITAAFLFAINGLFQEYITKVLLAYYNEYYENGKLALLLNIDNYSRKTTNGFTKFKTFFGDIWVPQIQIRTKLENGKNRQISITRILLDVSPRYQIPDFMKELIGWIGAVTTFRVGHNIFSLLTTCKCSLMTIWRSVQWSAKKINLGLSSDGINEFEGDGTGIPTKDSGKRGSELKKIFQRKNNGKLHLIGMSIGKYKDKSDWLSSMSELQVALKSGLKKYAKLVLSSDGDLSIINVAKGISSRIKIQKDKWHVYHQLKYYLWKDGVNKELKNDIIAHFYKLTMLSKQTIKKRNKQIRRYIFLLNSTGYKSTSVYLKSAMDGFYTHEIEGNKNIYTTKTERSMRTTNQRINVGIWSDNGALNVCKIRDAYYYNGINPFNWKQIA